MQNPVPYYEREGQITSNKYIESAILSKLSSTVWTC